jgi:hypothetical protein
MLNAYFEEWCVLSENAVNESSNYTDSCGFTWGRFWPYLAGWYGTSWMPPDNEKAYKISISR